MGFNDIDKFERKQQDKINIERICRGCNEFTETINYSEIPLDTGDGLISHNTIEYVNPTCLKNNRILVFSQIKSFDECPKNMW